MWEQDGKEDDYEVERLNTWDVEGMGIKEDKKENQKG